MQLSGLFLATSGKGFNWYGFLIGMAMVICIIGCYFLAKKRGYYSDLVFDIAILCLPLAIIGARLYYVVFDIIGSGGSWTFRRVFGLDGEGFAGLAVYGGLIGGCIGAVILILIKRKKEPQQKATFMQMVDLGFTFVILGQAIGRWGNFANQEAYGNPVLNESWQWFPYAVKVGAEWFQATFFYESMWNLVGFGILLWLYAGKRKSFDGFVFSVYCIWYGIGRTWIEGLRSDSLMAGPIRVSQILSILIILFGIIYILQHLYFARIHEKKPFVFVDEKKLDESYYNYDKSILHHPNVYMTREEKRAKKLEELENMSNYSTEFYDTEDEDKTDEEKFDEILSAVEDDVVTGKLLAKEMDDVLGNENEVRNEKNKAVMTDKPKPKKAKEPKVEDSPENTDS